MTRPPSSPLHPTLCEGCSARIWFAAVSNQLGKPPAQMPLNQATDPAGNVAAYCDDHGTWRARIIPRDGQPAPHEKRYMPHFATCTNPQVFRKRQRDAWRKAQADIHATQRRTRTSRPSKQATAIEQPGLFRYPGGTPR